MTVPYTGSAGAMAVANYVSGQLAAALSTPATRVDVRTGIIAWDACECGQFTVSVARMFNSSQFPVEDGAGLILGSGYLFVVQLSAAVMRCFPLLDDDGSPAAVQAMLDATAQIADDGYQLTRGIPAALDTLETSNLIAEKAMWPTLFPGPFGGCGGCQVDFQVALVK